MVCGRRGAVGVRFPLSGWAADKGVIGGSRWRAVVRSGSACEGCGGSTVVVSSAGEERLVCRVSVGVELWSYLAERGLGVVGGEESVLGGGDRSMLGPASDIREGIKGSSVQSQGGREVLATVSPYDGRTCAAQSGTGCGVRLDDGCPRPGNLPFQAPPPLGCLRISAHSRHGLSLPGLVVIHNCLGTNQYILYKPNKFYNARGDRSPNVVISVLNALNSSLPSTADIVSTVSWRDGKNDVKSQMGYTYVKVVASKTSRSYPNSDSVGAILYGEF